MQSIPVTILFNDATREWVPKVREKRHGNGYDNDAQLREFLDTRLKERIIMAHVIVITTTYFISPTTHI